jgi:phospholipid/cholesterol/gamma-HCH transport system substrate-binding protein
MGLALDLENPNRVTATIAIDQNTPLRADTKVGVDVQGLLGTPAISLKGGTPASPVPTGAPSEPPLLLADPDAGQDLMQTVRQALQRADKILSENAEPLKGTMENLRTFPAALSRNSDRIDGVMAGLERLAGGGPAEKPKQLYDLPAT